MRASLPGLPKKCKAVANALAKEVGLKVSGPSAPTSKRGLSGDVIKKLKDFFLQDGIAWKALEKKDRVIICERKEREKSRPPNKRDIMLL